MVVVEEDVAVVTIHVVPRALVGVKVDVAGVVPHVHQRAQVRAEERALDVQGHAIIHAVGDVLMYVQAVLMHVLDVLEGVVDNVLARVHQDVL